MKDENCEILLKYLRSILYDSIIETPDIGKLPGPYQELGIEMQVLQQVVERIRNYSEVLMENGFTELFHSMMELPCDKESHRPRRTEQSAFAHIIKDMTIEKAEKERLASKAYRDSLTGIRNRLYFEETMARILSENIEFTLCYIDLDHLKMVNDEYGHRAGDAYICRFADLIRSQIRDYDLFARIGGDEFCVVFLECREKVAAQKMARILEVFQQDRTYGCVSSFSYGLVEAGEPSETYTLDEILSRADAKMYEMKRRHKAEAGRA